MESIFWAALQSSFILGLIHGINPCGHSWLVLAPFVSGEKKGRYVAMLTISFVSGTALACLLLGATLGTVSSMLPASADIWVDSLTSIILFLLGILLLIDPHLLHHHDDHDHDDHDCGSGNEDHCREAACKKAGRKEQWLAATLFSIGFVNMIIPCPTAAVMYGYALNSSSGLAATVVFGSYAFATAIGVSTVIYLIYRTTAMAGRLQKKWVEPLIMRSAGAVIVIFSIYGLYSVAIRISF